MTIQHNGFIIRTGTDVAGGWFAVATPTNHETTLVTKHHDDESGAIDTIKDAIDEYRDEIALAELVEAFGIDNIAIIEADEVR